MTDMAINSAITNIGIVGKREGKQLIERKNAALSRAFFRELYCDP